jgi:TonB family protein
MSRTTPLAALLLAGLVPAAAGAAKPQPAQPVQMLPTLFSDEDYPPSAIRNNEQGPVGFRLEVGDDGTPSGCAVVSSSGSQALDATTCRLLMERARFRPARDSRGRPTTDQFTGRIIWRMAEEEPDTLQAAQYLWATCVMGEAAKLVPGDLPADEVVLRAFPPCAALEALVAREVEKPVPLEEVRSSFDQTLRDMVARTRVALKPVPDAPPPPGK